jgi:RNA-directed DNA polymerase
VKENRSPFDGDWIYWSTRLGRHPGVTKTVGILLKRQQGKCQECGQYFIDEDKMVVDHRIPKEWGGSSSYNNLQLLHRHCHDVKTAREREVLAV